MSASPEREAAIFNAARKLPVGERIFYLDGACAGDAPLRQRVGELLRANDEAGAFLPELATGAEESPRAGAAPGPDGTVRVAPGFSEQPGDSIDRYKLLEKIGEGGFGVVYVAEQKEPVKRRVALKIIKPGMDTRQVVARFSAERQALAMMDHPNIARVLDAGATSNGRPFFVMELVKGVKLTDYCDMNMLSTKERLDLFIQVCRAIQHAHQKGIIHRDIKPSNILVTLHDGVPVPKVIDFGIAKATQGELTDQTVYTQYQQLIGTPAYMSPEQAEMSGLDIDTRCDIYSLGVLLYELLTGKTPFDPKELVAAGLEQMRRTIREREPVRPSTRLSTMVRADLTNVAKSRQTDAPRLLHLVRGDLDWIVMKALEKDRSRRYETANSLVDDIQRHLKNEPVAARPPSNFYRLQKAWRRHRATFAFVILTAAMLLAATGISAWQAIRASRAQTAAKQRLEESEAISKFLTEVFQSSDPARDSRTITVAETLGAAAKKLELELAGQPARRAKLQATLGITYTALGLYGEAIPLQEKVRDYLLDASGPEHPDTLRAMENLAFSYDAVDQQNEALKLMEQVLPISRKINGPEHPDTLTAMQQLANLYAEAGRQNEALKLMEQVLSLRSKANGPEHPNTLTAMLQLASFYDGAGRKDEALKLREQALPLSRKVNGPEHPDTLTAMQALAFSCCAVGRHDEALKLMEQVLPLRRKVNGPEHPGTIWAMHGLANACDAVGRHDESLRLMEQVLPLGRKVDGPEHLSTLWAMEDLANARDIAGRRDEALTLWEELLPLRRKVNGPEHLSTLWAMRGLANACDAAGRQDEALKLWQQLLPLRRKVQGPEHVSSLCAMQDLANACDIAGRRDEALTLWEQLLPLRRKVNGPESSETLWAMSRLAFFYDETGRKDEALKLRKDLLLLRRKVLGPNRPDTLMVMLPQAQDGDSLAAWVTDMRQFVMQYPEDTECSMRLALLQLLLGKDEEHQTLCRRLLTKAAASSDPAVHNCAAKVCLLQAHLEPETLRLAAESARRALALAQPGDGNLPCFQIVAGLAACRERKDAEAESLLTQALDVSKEPDQRGLALAFRALARLHTGRADEAGADLAEVEQMKLPEANRAQVSALSRHPDQLAIRLACDEAKAALARQVPLGKP